MRTEVEGRIASPRSNYARHPALLPLGAEGSSDGEDLFRALTEHTPVGVFVTDSRGECIYVNARACAITGLTMEQLLGGGWMSALHPEDAERVQSEWARASAAGHDFDLEYRFLRQDGSVRWVEEAANAVQDRHGKLVAWVGICADVTERRRTDERYRELVDRGNDAVFTADTAGNFTSVNPAAERITGFSRNELLEMSFFDLIAPEHVERAQASFAQVFAHGAEVVELQLVAKGGRAVFVEVAGRLVEEGGAPVALEGIARETTEQRALEDDLAHQVLHDALTGLPNRVLFKDRLDLALPRAAREGRSVAVALLDLDNFKLVNDSLGHAAGDELLKGVATRLRRSIREGDTVARLGGDEFAFVLEGVHDDHEVIELAECILASLGAPFTLGQGEQRIGASLGIALGVAGDGSGALLHSADTAMYRAKDAGGGGYEVFDARMRARVKRDLTMRRALGDALKNHEISVHYQPIVALASGELIAVEALVRWLHPQWGWVPPSEFIPLAERDGSVIAVGQFVQAETTSQMARWRHQFPKALPLGVFVNVSPRELSQPDFVSRFTGSLNEQGLGLSDVGVEITERVFIDETDRQLGRNLEELARMGVGLSLDDFGTGYSALASIQRLPLTALKIDRVFIGSIRELNDRLPIVTAIVSLGRALGLTVIAEGVETQVQADYLRALGCDAAQGFHFARPQPADELTQLLATGSWGWLTGEESRPPVLPDLK